METSPRRLLQRPLIIFLLALISNLLWGSAFPSIKLGYGFFAIGAEDTAAQILFAGLRFTLAGAMVILVMSLAHRTFLCPRSLKSVKHALTLSTFQTILQYSLFYIGLAHTSGVKGSIIEGSNVFIAILVASLIFRQEALTARKLLGSVIGFLGVLLINLSSSSGSISFLPNLGDACIFFSTFAYAVSSVLLKRYAPEEDTVMLSGWQFLFGGLLLMLLGFLLGGRLTAWTGAGCAMLLYLAFISAMAYSLWALLLSANPVSRIAVLGFMNPVFGVLLSSLLLGEGQSLGLAAPAALLLVCAGIFVVYDPLGAWKERKRGEE